MLNLLEPSMVIGYRKQSGSVTNSYYVQYIDDLTKTQYQTDISQFAPGSGNTMYFQDKDAHPKFGFRREGANGYITEDGVTWTKVSTILPYESTKGLYLFGKYDGSQKAQFKKEVHLHCRIPTYCIPVVVNRILIIK